MTRVLAAVLVLVGSLAIGVAVRAQTTAEPCVSGASMGTPEAGGVRFTGAGDSVSEAFGLPAGTVLFSATIEGTGRNDVTLYPAPGSSIEAITPLVFSSNGARYSGSGAFDVSDAGEYVVEVAADGDWSISFGY